MADEYTYSGPAAPPTPAETGVLRPRRIIDIPADDPASPKPTVRDLLALTTGATWKLAGGSWVGGLGVSLGVRLLMYALDWPQNDPLPPLRGLESDNVLRTGGRLVTGISALGGLLNG